MELVTVIVPVYNNENYLDRCVNSIVNQTYENIEIILVDDGSPDNCPKLCDDWTKKDERIKVIHKSNEGLGLTRNAGLQIATGKFVAFIDSDDWISVTHIENMVNKITVCNADVALGGCTRVKEEQDTGFVSNQSLEKRVYSGNDVLTNILLPLIGPDSNRENDIVLESSSCMNLYSLRVINDYNIKFPSEREVVAEDIFFNVLFFSHSKTIIATQEVGYYYFFNNQSISRKFDKRRIERTLKYYDALKNVVDIAGIQIDVNDRVKRSFLTKVRVCMKLIVYSDISKKEKKQLLGEIIKDDLVQKIVKTYPIVKYNVKFWPLIIVMRTSNVNICYFLFVIREKGE